MSVLAWLIVSLLLCCALGAVIFWERRRADEHLEALTLAFEKTLPLRNTLSDVRSSHDELRREWQTTRDALEQALQDLQLLHSHTFERLDQLETRVLDKQNDLETYVDRQIETARPPLAHLDRALAPTLAAVQQLLAPQLRSWGVGLFGTTADGAEPVLLHKSGTSFPGAVEIHAFQLPRALRPQTLLFCWGPVLLRAVQINDTRVLDQQAPLHVLSTPLPHGQKIIFQVVVS